MHTLFSQTPLMRLFIEYIVVSNNTSIKIKRKEVISLNHPNIHKIINY